jgi:hypothetical protein
VSLAALAERFHWSPTELLELSAEDLRFWEEAIGDLERAKREEGAG